MKPKIEICRIEENVLTRSARCVSLQNLPSLEILDLSDSKQLIECPNVSGSPNLKSVIFNGCESLPHVDSSILSLQKLLYLCLDQCKSLKRFSSSTCPPSLRYLTFMGCINLQEFSMPMPGIASIDSFHLSLELCRLNELPSSILHAKNMEGFYCPISDKVADLPENFARGFILTDPVKHERDSSITLRKVMSSPAFLTMGWLFFRWCPSVSEIPDNISLSLALEILLLFHMGIRSLPETIKYLPRLKRLEVGECKMLRSIPALPQSIKFVYVWKCESLETVSGSTGEPSEKPIYDLLLLNCIKLDQLSYGTIFKDAIVEVELKARLFHLDHGGLICLFPATTGSIVQDWFPYHSTKALVTVELPPSFLGFVFYLVLSQGHMGVDGSVGCECYLETSSGKWITIPRFFINKIKFKQLPTVKNNTSINVVTDHVLLWHDASHCKSIMEAVEERKAINDSSSYERLTCRFFIDQPNLNDEVEIKECGLRWIYPSEDQIVEEGRGCKSKRSREIHELESAVQNRLEGSQSDEQEEMVNPTKKLKQCVARNTNEAKENQGKQGDITDPTTQELRRSKREKKANKLYTDFVVQKWRIRS